MPSLKAIRQRIASVKSTRQVTSAMKMVAAAKLRKAQNRVIQIRPYVHKIVNLIQDLISGYYDDFDSKFFREKNEGKIMLIVIASNRGLCGAFNMNIAKKILEVIDNYKKQGIKNDDFFIFSFGKKVPTILKYKKINIDEENDNIFDKLTYENTIPFVQKFINKFLNGEVRKIELIYNSFKSAGTQIIKHEQLLPFETENNKKFYGGYIIEPNFETVLERLIPEALQIKLYSAILDSFASEQAARMTAMHKATDNATEMIKQLTLTYNKARQAAITKEILEIVGGAEALKNG